MDASQITKLLQKQNTRYINRCQTVDASTLIWKNQIQSSKYIKGVKTCEGDQNTSNPANPACSDGQGICSFGGAGRTSAIQTGSPQQFLNVLSGAAGSASQVYSSESITLQRAGKEACGVAPTNPAPANSYVVLPGGDPATSNSELQVPSCSYLCTNTNGPTNGSTPPINNQSNPYLPPFDTYYRFKNPSAQCQYPIQDQNQKHFVKQCHSRFPNANNGVSVNCTECANSPETCNGCILQTDADTGGTSPEALKYWATTFLGVPSQVQKNSVAYSTDGVFVTGSFDASATGGTMSLTDVGSSVPKITLQSVQGGTNITFIAKYLASGELQWATVVDGSLNQDGYSIASDGTNAYVIGQYINLTNPMSLYNATTTGTYPTGSTPVTITLPATGVAIATFVLKIDTTGTIQWATILNGPGPVITTNVFGYGISVTGSDVYVSGYYSNGTLNIYQNASTSIVWPAPAAYITMNISFGGNTDAFLVKLNASGATQWATKLYRSGAAAVVNALALASDTTGVYVTGTISANTSVYNSIPSGVWGVPVPVSVFTLSSTGPEDAFLVKYNTAGFAQWGTKMECTGINKSFSASSDSAGGVYVTGYYDNASIDLFNAITTGTGPGPGTAQITLTNSGNSDAFVAKFNASSGAVQWATILYGTASSIDNGYGISADGTGVYVCGLYDSSLMDVYNAITTGTWPSPAPSPFLSLPNSGLLSDVFVVKYNTSGTVQWATAVGGALADYGFGISSSGSSVYLVGKYSSNPLSVYNAITSGSTLGSAVTTLSNGGTDTTFLIKYTSAGAVDVTTY
jgi:hypothetical protein